MSLELRNRLFAELDSLMLIDPHTHINPHEPASRTLADILGYHYYTELAHSAGLSRDEIEDDRLSGRDKVALLVRNLAPLNNTVQYSWFIELAREFFGFQGEVIGEFNWEDIYASAEVCMSRADWAETVLGRAKIEAVFLTNDFDDPLEDFDTNTYIPCLRTDDLVFNLTKSDVRKRLESATNISLRDVNSLRRSIEKLFRHFKSKGARACAISLPPNFEPAPVTHNRAGVALDEVLRRGAAAAETHVNALKSYTFWTLAEMCDRYSLPFDLMIGVNRNVYSGGVHQGRDLYDSRCSLMQYKTLFNAFPKVTFPISVLASVTNQELASFAWIFPNVVTNGHWWYSNTPTFIEHDLAARLEAVPRTKQIGYYSDAYKLEFALPKFAMYKRILAKVLAEKLVADRGWSEERAVELGQQLLRGNVESIFKFGEDPTKMPSEGETSAEDSGPISGGPSFAAPISAGEQAYPPVVSQPGGIGSVMAGIGVVGAAQSIGGSDFGPAAFEPQGLRERDDFVFNPMGDDNDVQLSNAPPIPAAGSGSGFALDESDRIPGEETLDLGELGNLGDDIDLNVAEEVGEIAMDVEAVEEPPGMFDNVTDDPNAPPDPSLRFRHSDMPEEHVQPMISDRAGKVESEAEERVASEIDLLPAAEEPEELEEQIIAIDDEEEVVAIDLSDLEADPDGTLVFGEEAPAVPPPLPESVEPPVEEPKKQDDGSINFDFLK